MGSDRFRVEVVPVSAFDDVAVVLSQRRGKSGLIFWSIAVIGVVRRPNRTHLRGDALIWIVIRNANKTNVPKFSAKVGNGTQTDRVCDALPSCGPLWREKETVGGFNSRLIRFWRTRIDFVRSTCGVDQVVLKIAVTIPIE